MTVRIRQGDLYWLDMDGEGQRPAVIVQNDATNGTGIRTVFLALLTSNLRRAEDAGNLLLEPEEANLPRREGIGKRCGAARLGAVRTVQPLPQRGDSGADSGGNSERQ